MSRIYNLLLYKSFKNSMLCFFVVVDITGPAETTIAEFIHELIKLSSLVSYSEDKVENSVKLEIAGCLGEIGAADLAVVALTEKLVKGVFYTLISRLLLNCSPLLPHFFFFQRFVFVLGLILALLFFFLVLLSRC